MSQYRLIGDKGEDIVFGFDHVVCGYFVTALAPGNKPEDEPVILIMADSLFTGLTGLEMVRTLEQLCSKIPGMFRDVQSGARLTWQRIRSSAMLDLTF